MLACKLTADDYCQGVVFEVNDVDKLARAIALTLVQEYKLARMMVTGATGPTSAISLTANEINEIIARRLHPTDIYHRDGFLFQIMMWLASHLDLQNGDLVALPHAQGSAKGQDCIIVHRSKTAVIALTICEDKATDNPRKTVREEVWPEIETYELGGRRDELRSNVIATLGIGGVSMDDAVELIRGICWNGKCRYRVRVTVEPGGRMKGLFKDFNTIVSGDNDKRRGETVPLPSMRSWMTALAGKVEDELQRFVNSE